MQTISDSFLGKQILWHATTRENADAIRREGFRPARKSGHNLIRQATWFYHVTTFAEGGDTGPDVGFVVSVDLNLYERGRDYAHEMENTVVFKVPLPPDCLVATLNWPQITGAPAVVEALGSQWQGDVISDLEECCCNPEITWSQKKSISEMLWSLAPNRYFDSGVICHLLAAEVPGLSIDEAQRHAWLLLEHCPRFLSSLLRLYHKTFLSPRLARATMIAAARHLPPAGVLALAEGLPSSNDSCPEATEVANFARATLPKLPTDELVRGAIEMASMRHFPGKDADFQYIGDWVAERANEAEEAAFHYIKFAGDSFPARHAGHIARDLAVRILREIGKDYFECLIALGDTDDLEILSGVIRAFADFRDQRAVPFLASRLRDARKGPRSQAVRALGRIGTPDALAAVRSIANDKRKVVRKAVQQALEVGEHQGEFRCP